MMPDLYAAGAFAVEIYDDIPLHQARPDTAFYKNLALRYGGPVLELGCGTGRILLEIAREGLEVTGIDSSNAMLDRLTAKLQAEPAEVKRCVRWRRADMTRFDLPDRFRLAVIPFRGFQHLLSREAQLECLKQVLQHLKPGGILALDVIAAPSAPDSPLFEPEIEPEFRLPDGRRVLRHGRLLGSDPAECVDHFAISYRITHPDGQIEEHTDSVTLRRMTAEELGALSAEAGFEHVRIANGFDNSQPETGPDLVLVTERPP